MGLYVTRETALLTGTIVVLTTLMLPLFAATQQPVQVRRIAFLELSFPPSAPGPRFEEFRHGLRERGWVEGHNLAIEWRWAEGNRDRFATLVDEVIRLQVEVIVVPNLMTAVIAHKVTTTIPIVVRGGGDLITSQLIASPARPGGNVTGVSTFAPDIATKQLELLKQAVPGVTRVAVLRGLASHETALQVLAGVARSLEVELHRFEVPDSTAFESAFAAMKQAQAQALLVLGDPFFLPYRQQIADLAAQQHLPSICTAREYAEAGCLMGYSTSRRGRGQQIATYVDKILRGASPADLPVEQPMKFELVINLKTAQALGITLPPLVLFQADEVIQ
jgi:putative ABC transport system substrate-binding protein